MTANNGSGPWYYAAGSEQRGPFTWDQMGPLVRNATVGPDTLVWSPGMPGWVPASQTPLASLAAVAAPPAPPPMQPAPVPAPPMPQAAVVGGTIASAPPPPNFGGYAQPGFGAGAPGQRVTGFGEAISTCFRKYAVFSGRASRPEFWFFQLFGLMVGVPAALADLAIFGAGNQGILNPIVSLALLLPNIAVAVRRLHDTDRSGAWLLLIALPIIGWIVLLVFYCQRETPGPNRFGQS